MPQEANVTIVRLLGAIALLMLLMLGFLGFAGYYTLQFSAKAQEALDRQTIALHQDMRAMRISIQAMQQDMKGMRTSLQAMQADMGSMRTDMRQVKQSMATMVGDLEQAQAAAQQAAREIAQRQRLLDQRLVARSRQTLARTRDLGRRRDALAGPPPWGTFSKLDRMLALQQLLADELLIMTEHLAETQAIAARELRPLPIQGRPSR